MRDPSQVFTLLETLYHAFDEVAKRRRVYKVTLSMRKLHMFIIVFVSYSVILLAIPEGRDDR